MNTRREKNITYRRGRATSDPGAKRLVRQSLHIGIPVNGGKRDKAEKNKQGCSEQEGEIIGKGEWGVTGRHGLNWKSWVISSHHQSVGSDWARNQTATKRGEDDNYNH